MHHCYVAGPGRIAAAALAFSIVTGAILLVACGGRNANLFASCEAGDVDRIKSLLDRGADVNARNRNGETPLMVAAGLLYPDAVRLLIARGADVNAETGGGETALSLALGTQRPEGSPEVEADLDKVVDLLVRHGATR
ncbi:MAG: ankyrin repeat domain-containing protein [Desulfomonile sp.]|nr:ankyrin repeat domain-containing protein [Desulfomonile sp.]